MAQGVLPFQYAGEKESVGTTALGGLPLYLDLVKACGLIDSIREHVNVAGKQGWLDIQMVLALMFLNIAGGDCLDDLDRLEHDAGFKQVLREIERGLLSRKERVALKLRWRKKRSRSLPSPSAAGEWLARFHDADEEKRREAGKAFIPALTEGLSALWRCNRNLVGFLGVRQPETVATLDMDATLIETHKRTALHSYKGFKAYQPLNCWWAEQQVMLYSEFRDGNVPAGHEQLRVMKDSLPALPANVTKVYVRSDSAGYQQDFILYCGEGKDERFGVIEFAISADVTQEFRKAVLEVAETDWQPLIRRDADGHTFQTDQEWAEVCFVPSWAGHSKKRADYRFLAIREPLRELNLDDPDQLPFPTQEFARKGRFKLFGVVTNRTLPGDQVIWWLRERCGKSEEVHSVMKSDLAGGQMPSGLFGANAAWWAIMVLANNLNAIMKQLVLGKPWVAKRMKALRFGLINLPGRVIQHGRRLILRISAAGQTLAMLLTARQTIQRLATIGPGG